MRKKNRLFQPIRLSTSHDQFVKRLRIGLLNVVCFVGGEGNSWKWRRVIEAKNLSKRMIDVKVSANELARKKNCGSFARENVFIKSTVSNSLFELMPRGI